MARGRAFRTRRDYLTVRRHLRERAADLAPRGPWRLVALLDSSSVGGWRRQPCPRWASRQRTSRGDDHLSRWEAGQLDCRSRTAAASGPRATMEHADQSAPHERPWRMALRWWWHFEQLDCFEWRAAQRQAEAERRHRSRLYRLQAPRRIPVSQGEQQRRLSSRASRGADPGRLRYAALERPLRGRLRIPRA